MQSVKRSSSSIIFVGTELQQYKDISYQNVYKWNLYDRKIGQGSKLVVQMRIEETSSY